MFWLLLGARERQIKYLNALLFDFGGFFFFITTNFHIPAQNFYPPVLTAKYTGNSLMKLMIGDICQKRSGGRLDWISPSAAVWAVDTRGSEERHWWKPGKPLHFVSAIWLCKQDPRNCLWYESAGTCRVLKKSHTRPCGCNHMRSRSPNNSVFCILSGIGRRFTMTSFDLQCNKYTLHSRTLGDCCSERVKKKKVQEPVMWLRWWSPCLACMEAWVLSSGHQKSKCGDAHL